jgi:hypothetical protein
MEESEPVDHPGAGGAERSRRAGRARAWAIALLRVWSVSVVGTLALAWCTAPEEKRSLLNLIPAAIFQCGVAGLAMYLSRRIPRSPRVAATRAAWLVGVHTSILVAIVGGLLAAIGTHRGGSALAVAGSALAVVGVATTVAQIRVVILGTEP